ncbi:MAG: beta-phosphoglucomutase [Clostridiales bacterium]|nr:beta-phosphoglucomutase [Clostridiales bacterium]
MNQPILGVIFDLDGVIVSTDNCHYLAWKRMADEEGIPFDRTINERLRGVSRMESLSIILEKATKDYTEAEKQEMATRKNGYYVELIQSLTCGDLLEGAGDALALLRNKGIKIAIGSSSRNTPIILKQIGLEDSFDAVADGNAITRSKPDPEVFLLAAKSLGLAPANCLVVEDADAGVEAALAGGMRVLGVGGAAANSNATFAAESLAAANFDTILTNQ